MLKWVITTDQIPEQLDSLILIHNFIELVKLFLPFKVLCQKKKEFNPIPQEPRGGGKRRGDGYRTYSDMSQCYKDELDHFTYYNWTHLQV
jgi:hypothetical protein